MKTDPETRSDAVFPALAHSVRREILDLLVITPGMTVMAVASHFAISRIAVMKHIRVLEDADLVLSEREGRCRKLFFNPMPIQLVYDRWTRDYSAFWSGHLADVKDRVETAAAKKESKRA